MTISEKLNKILEIKQQLKDYLVDAGQNPGDNFSQYLNSVKNIIKLSSISVTTNPTKTSYTAKESFSSSGMVVRATFSNSAYKNVTGYTVSPSGALKPTDKSVTISYKEFGETKTTTVSISVAAIKVTVPSQNGSLTYTGSSLSPTWANYDTSLMTISGTTSGTNAGSYTAKFTLKDKTNYTWADGTTADKSVTWTIGKAQASISLSKNSVTLNSDKLTDTVTITSVGMNSVAAMSSDTSIATISMSGSTLTISNVNETTGTATIVLSGEVNSNYNAPSYPTIAVSAEFAHDVVIAGGGQGTGVGYTLTVDDASYGFTNAWSHETVSTASATITSTASMGKIALNGEMVVSGTGEYTVDLSDATHVVFNRMMFNMMITTYNIDTVKDVTITVTGAGYSGLAQIEHNGIVYTGATKFTAKTGDLIRVSAKNSTTGNSDYYYLVTSDARVNMNYSTGSSGGTGSVGITTIPEGHASVTIIKNSAGSNCGVTIDDIVYGGKGSTVDTTLTVPVGTVIYCTALISDTDAQGYVSVNGIKVASGGVRNYAYTVKENISISMWGSKDGGVVEILNDPATITITGDDADYLRYASVEINGTSYNSGRYDGETVSIEVAAGTVIECSAFCPAGGTTGSTYVAVNGTNVKTATNTASSISYDYVVTGNASIGLRSREKYSRITITEQ